MVTSQLITEFIMLLTNILAVIYDNALTECFVKTMAKLLRQSSKPPVIYVALEKRYVFTLADCDVSAPCYDFFLECVHGLNEIAMEQVPIDFPQYFKYERAKELVLWKFYAKVSWSITEQYLDPRMILKTYWMYGVFHYIFTLRRIYYLSNSQNLSSAKKISFLT